jgi:transposase
MCRPASGIPKAVGAVFGLTPAKYQSGENDRTGAISRCGDEMMRMMLYEAAQSMLVRSTKWLSLPKTLSN